MQHVKITVLYFMIRLCSLLSMACMVRWQIYYWASWFWVCFSSSYSVTVFVWLSVWCLSPSLPSGPYLRNAAAPPPGQTWCRSLINTRSWPTTAACYRSTTTSVTSQVIHCWQTRTFTVTACQERPGQRWPVQSDCLICLSSLHLTTATARRHKSPLK